MRRNMIFALLGAGLIAAGFAAAPDEPDNKLCPISGKAIDAKVAEIKKVCKI